MCVVWCDDGIKKKNTSQAFKAIIFGQESRFYNITDTLRLLHYKLISYLYIYRYVHTCFVRRKYDETFFWSEPRMLKLIIFLLFLLSLFCLKVNCLIPSCFLRHWNETHKISLDTLTKRNQSYNSKWAHYVSLAIPLCYVIRGSNNQFSILSLSSRKSPFLLLRKWNSNINTWDKSTKVFFGISSKNWNGLFKSLGIHRRQVLIQ